MDFKCLDCGYEWNHSDMVGTRRCPECIGVNIERNPNAESVSANPLLGEVLAIDTEDLKSIAESMFDVEMKTLSIKEKEILFSGFISGVRYSKMKIQKAMGK